MSANRNSEAADAVNSYPAGIIPPKPTRGPQPQYLCTMNLTLGGEVGPIPLISGTNRIIEIIPSGTITGPGFKGKIEGGFAAPIRIAAAANAAAGTPPTQIPIAYVYGHADDGSPFYIEQSGVGTSAVQNARLQIDCGGKYEKLQRSYIIAQPTINAQRNAVSLACWTLPLPN